MNSTSQLSGFAARMRQLIAAGSAEPGQFQSLALELFALQFQHNLPYRRFCEARGSTRENVAHWRQIPAVPTVAFKELELSCLPNSEQTRVFHSSGTTQQRPSRHFHGQESLAVYEASLWQWFAAHAPVRPDQALMLLTPPPQQAPHSSLVHMFDVISRRLDASGPACLGTVAADGGWMVDASAALCALREAQAAARPSGILGTAFSFVQLLDLLAQREARFELPPGSWALETGGYKGRSRALSKKQLQAAITHHLGIASSRILCEYGMSELSSQAYDAHIANGDEEGPNPPRLFRFPPWARAQLVSPETDAEVADGETGLVRVFDLANVHSVLAIQTEDLAIRRGERFELIGRAPAAEARGCSLMSASPA